MIETCDNPCRAMSGHVRPVSELSNFYAHFQIIATIVSLYLQHVFSCFCSATEFVIHVQRQSGRPGMSGH